MKRSDKAIDDTRDIAIRIIDKLVNENLIPNSIQTGAGEAIWFDTEFEIQDIIFEELIKMKIMPYKKAQLRRFINSLPRENMKWKNKLDDILYERDSREHYEYMLDYSKEARERNRILAMKQKVT